MRRRALHTIGITLTVASSIAITLTIVAAALGLVLVGRVHHSIDDNLGVTIQAIDAIDESITLSRQVTDSIATALDGAATTITTVQTTMSTATGTLDTIHTVLTGSLTNSIVSIQNVLPTIKSGASAIETALTDISKLPIGPDYKPAVPFAESIQDLSDAIATTPADLDSLATNVQELKASTAALDVDLASLSATISTLHDDIVAVRNSLDNYAPVIDDARRVADSTRSNLRTDAALARFLVIILALALVLSEAVSLCIGRLLTANAPGADQTPAQDST